MKRKIYSYCGQEYTLVGLAKTTGVNVKTLEGRLGRGLSIDAAIALGAGRKVKLYNYHGEMLSMAQLAARSSIAKQSIAERLHKGWTIEDAVDLPIGARARSHGKKRPNALETTRPSECTTDNERDRWFAALKIFQQIGSVPKEWNFRCIVPEKEYAFESELLRWNIRFRSDGKLADLTARYKEHGFDSDFKRTFQVLRDNIQEVEVS